METKIILTTDFTEASENAIRYVLQLYANTPDVTFLLLHVHNPIVPFADTGGPSSTENKQLENSIKNKLEKRVAKFDQSLNVSSIFEKGSVKEVVNALVEKEHPDLIVMGSRDKAFMERVTLGSNAILVALTAQCPVLIVPLESMFAPLQNVAFAADFKNPDVSRESFQYLKSLIQSNDANLQVVHVYKSENIDFKKESISKLFHHFLEEVKHKHHPVINKNVYDGILSFIEEQKPEMMAVIPRDREVFEDMFHSSITRKMAFHGQIPLLVLKSQVLWKDES